MGIDIRINYVDIKDFEKRLEDISERLKNGFFEECLNRIGSEGAANAAQQTPVISGNLKGNWGITKVTKNGDVWNVDIINGADYALYVEEGHRQEVGRFVPVLGKRLKEPFVEGKHMLRNSLAELTGPYARDYLRDKVLELFTGGL